jgi:transglutaminase-like putative cysteine protease
MARQQDPTAGRQRLVALAAVASLSLVTAFAFGRVFTGRAAMWELAAAALASVLVAGLFERRSLALALLASLAGLALALTWLVFPQTAWYGLPTLRTLRAVGRSLEFVAQQTRVQVAPTPPLPPLMLAAVTATWTAAFSTHALAIRAGSPLLAVLPSVALVGFADTVLEDGARPFYAVGFILAALAVVFVDGLRRIRQWGPVWSSLRGRRLSRPASRGARHVALAAVTVAVLVPGLLPGFRSQALVDFSTSPDDGIRLDPFVSIQAELERDEPVDLFQVTSAGGAAYWRLYALDRFDGTTWSSSDPEAERGQVLDSPAVLTPVVPPPPSAESLAQQVRVLRDLDDPWLPMAYPAESITTPEESIRYQSDLAMVVLEGGLEEGFEYGVQSRILSPDPAQLDAIRFGPASTYGTYTSLPADIDPRVGELAERWAGEGSPYRQVLAIQNRFRDGSFLYSLDVEPVADSDALLAFLTENRQGFCQQFATAMAVMVRELGYPARVAVGFRSGSPDGETFLVQSKDAHAWVEVFFPGVGWLAFEPTPGRSNPIGEPGTYLSPASAEEGGGEAGGGAGQEGALGGGNASCTAGNGDTLPGQLANADPNACVPTRPERGFGADLPIGFLGGTEAPPADDGGYSIPYRWILLGFAAAAGLLLLVTPVAKWAWRRRILRRARDPRDRVLAAYRVFDGRAADVGLGRREGETVEEHRARLSAAAALSDGHLTRLSSATVRAAYAAEPPSPDQAREAVRDARTAIAEVRRHAGLLRRLAGTYRPGV